MKKTFKLALLFFFLGNINLSAQILNFSAAIQEHDQWCWAGASKSILDYYGDTTLQCEIAEYTRSVATWHSFGNVDCCNDPTQGCNYWNYNYGYSGSIKDILLFFGGINNYGTSSILTKQQIADNLSQGRPFVIRWGWYSGGGHFVVGYGKSNSTIYYMNPWFGEGLKFADYDWVKDDGNHQWTHTNIITTSPLGVNKLPTIAQNNIKLFPNPSDGNFIIELGKLESNTKLEIINSQGQKIYSQIIENQSTKINLNYQLSSGLYFIKIIDKTGIRLEKMQVLYKFEFSAV